MSAFREHRARLQHWFQRHPPRDHPVRWSLAALGSLGGLAVLLWITAPKPEAILSDLPSLVVDAYTVARRDITPQAAYTGRLQPQRSAALRFEVSGRLLTRAVEPGREVAFGTPLLELDDRDFRDRLDTAEAELRLEESRITRDRAQLKQVERHRDLQREEVERHIELGQRSLLSRSALNRAEQALTDLESQVASLTFSVRTAEDRLKLRQTQADQAARDLARTRLVAPFDGQVNAVMVEVGDRITGEQPVVTLVDLDALDFYVEVDGLTASALQLEQELEVEVAGQQRAGRLVALQADPDPRTFTHAVRIRLPGSTAPPGLLATTRIPLPTLPQALVVPVEAVRIDLTGQSVYRINGNQLERVNVQLGMRDGEWQVVRGPLNEGDYIVARDVAAMDLRRSVTVRNHDP